MDDLTDFTVTVSNDSIFFDVIHIKPEKLARRMAACINACAGIPTEALEAGRVIIFQKNAQVPCDGRERE